jgi:hypothetical protein
MKTTASNGTVLEVGKKYRRSIWSKDNYLIVQFIGKVNFFADEKAYPIKDAWIPYEEPLPKPFEGYQKWYCIHNGIRIVYAEIRPVMIVGSCLTESEIIELGLKI